MTIHLTECRYYNYTPNNEIKCTCPRVIDTYFNWFAPWARGWGEQKVIWIVE